MSPSTKDPPRLEPLSPPDRQVKVLITARSPLHYISVYNAAFELRGRALGQLRMALSPGAYKIRYRSGPVIREDLVWLSENEYQERRIEGPELPLRSPLPLRGGSNLEPEHRSAFRRFLGGLEVPSPGSTQSSNIVLGIRSAAADVSALAGLRIELLSRTGQILADLSVAEQARQVAEGLSCHSLLIDQGYYIARVTYPKGRVLEQAVFALAGFATVIMLGADLGTHEVDGLEARFETSVTMFRATSGYEDWENAAVLGEIARQQLMDPEEYPSAPDWEEVTRRAVDNPLVAVFVAHCALRAGLKISLSLPVPAPPLRLLPDWQAVSLSLSSGVLERSRYRFSLPPMLNASWSRIIEASADDIDLIPLGSPASDREMEHWSGTPWLTWKASTKRPHTAIRAVDLHRLEVEVELRTLLQLVPKPVRDARLSTKPGEVSADSTEKFYDAGRLTVPERRLMNYALWLAHVTASESTKYLDTLGVGTNQGTLRHLLQSVVLPASVIAQLIAVLPDKLRHAASHVHKG